MKLWRLILLVVVAGCQPPPHKRTLPVSSTMPQPVTAAVTAQSVEVPTAWRIRWEYPYKNANNVSFEVWASQSLLEWTPATNTLIMEVAFPTKTSEFFKVRAVDLVTGQVSDWGTTATNH